MELLKFHSTKGCEENSNTFHLKMPYKSNKLINLNDIFNMLITDSTHIQLILICRLIIDLYNSKNSMNKTKEIMKQNVSCSFVQVTISE